MQHVPYYITTYCKYMTAQIVLLYIILAHATYKEIKMGETNQSYKKVLITLLLKAIREEMGADYDIIEKYKAIFEGN